MRRPAPRPSGAGGTAACATGWNAAGARPGCGSGGHGLRHAKGNGGAGNRNAPAGRHGALRNRCIDRNGAGIHQPPASAAILACDGDLRVVERVVHRPVSGQTALMNFKPSGYPTLRLQQALGKCRAGFRRGCRNPLQVNDFSGLFGNQDLHAAILRPSRSTPVVGHRFGGAAALRADPVARQSGGHQAGAHLLRALL